MILKGNKNYTPTWHLHANGKKGRQSTNKKVEGAISEGVKWNQNKVVLKKVNVALNRVVKEDFIEKDDM